MEAGTRREATLNRAARVAFVQVRTADTSVAARAEAFRREAVRACRMAHPLTAADLRRTAAGRMAGAGVGTKSTPSVRVWTARCQTLNTHLKLTKFVYGVKLYEEH